MIRHNYRDKEARTANIEFSASWADGIPIGICTLIQLFCNEPGIVC